MQNAIYECFLNLEADGLQQTVLAATPVSKEQETKATLYTEPPKFGQLIVKCFLVC